MDKKTHAINLKLFFRLGYKSDHMYEVELVKSEIEKEDPITVRFCFLNTQSLRS